MNRKIKFRAWDVGLKEMIPVYDIQFHDPVTRHIDGISLKPKTTQPTIINKRTTWRQVHEEDAVLMQFTGLTDKNGKEIYEGDIFCLPEVNTGAEGLRLGFIFGHEDKFIVEWDNEWHAWSLNRSGDLNNLENNTFINQVRCMMTDGSCEVVGNIYETPELLEN